MERSPFSTHELFVAEREHGTIDRYFLDQVYEKLKLFTPVGEGNNATVIEKLGGSLDGLCLKLEKPLPLLRDKDLASEFDALEYLHRHGVRVPMPIVVIHDVPHKLHYLIMERINGYSVQDIVNGIGTLPDSFNYDVFEGELRTQVQKMHSLLYHHRDLHAGNIMVADDGMPVIIDFGTYGIDIGGERDDDVYREEARVLDQTTRQYTLQQGIYRHDTRMVDSTLLKLKTHIRQLA